ncbi:hypothetical protein RHS01_04290 [Rhizoctonia solani]|uniref:DUF3533 domain-containing protein n=1 Tax=Rhizoctonia solani TaxID=456999 RepID=A0A8H7IFI8_9AGAM|nr:hypothetical protein RHS01_04290 [Rhizoctonia solani]
MPSSLLGISARSNTHAPSLKTWVVDRDGGEVGRTVVQGLLATTQSGTKQHLGWIEVPGDHVDNVGEAIVDEQAWGAVVINPGASAALATARTVGNSTYNPMTAITFYYAQARNEQATGTYVNPLTTQALTQILQQYNAQSASSYLASVSGNATALQAVTSAPLTLTSGIWWTTENLRPFNAPVATALTMVGQIYLCIFAFTLISTDDEQRRCSWDPWPIPPSPIVPDFTYRCPPYRLLPALILFRYGFAPPSVAPFGAKYTYGGGFFLYFAYTYMGMAALGLATEAMVTILTPRFMAFFLLPLIISNVSVTALPFDLQPSFYQYGHAFPVFNNSQAVRTILFNTKNHLGLNAGVLLGWIALSCITIPLFTTFMRRKDVSEHKKQVEEKANNEKRV